MPQLRGDHHRVHGAPGVPGVVVIVVGPAPVHAGHPLLQAAGGDVVLLHTALDPLLQGGVDKDLQALRPVPQNVVAAPAHDDAGALVGQLPNDLRLGEEGLMAHRHPLVGQSGGADAHRRHRQVEPAAGPLLRPGDEVGGKPALLRGLLNNRPVIAGDAQLGGQPLANQPSAAAKLPADGDHIVAHRSHLPVEMGQSPHIRPPPRGFPLWYIV